MSHKNWLLCVVMVLAVAFASTADAQPPSEPGMGMVVDRTDVENRTEEQSIPDSSVTEGIATAMGNAEMHQSVVGKLNQLYEKTGDPLVLVHASVYSARFITDRLEIYALTREKLYNKLNHFKRLLNEQEESPLLELEQHRSSYETQLQDLKSRYHQEGVTEAEKDLIISEVQAIQIAMDDITRVLNREQSAKEFYRSELDALFDQDAELDAFIKEDRIALDTLVKTWSLNLLSVARRQGAEDIRRLMDNPGRVRSLGHTFRSRPNVSVTESRAQARAKALEFLESNESVMIEGSK